MAPGIRKKFGALIFEPEVFGKQMYCFEKVLMALLWVLAPAVIRRPGNIPIAPFVTSLVLCNKNRKMFRK